MWIELQMLGMQKCCDIEKRARRRSRRIVSKKHSKERKEDGGDVSPFISFEYYLLLDYF